MLQESNNVSPKLINPNADANTRKLMEYLCDIYGKRVLTGQQIGLESAYEIEVIHETTGHYPAVYGFDMMDYSPSRTERGSTTKDVETAIDWWRSGGIVTFCWHWNAPLHLIDEPPERNWDKGFYTNATTFDLALAISNPQSEEYRLLLRDIDVIAGHLLRLQDAGVPVLWRPLHEASGGWFWWGAKGPDPCIKLWKLMYERLTLVHKLNNLIWVWNGQHVDWYPGDEWVDIIGEDIYPAERDYGSQKERFDTARAYSDTNKIIALSENGTIPDPDAMIQDKAIWSWNCTWYSGFVYRNEGDTRVYSDKYTDLAQIIKFYNHPLTITKAELPSFKK